MVKIDKKYWPVIIISIIAVIAILVIIFSRSSSSSQFSSSARDYPEIKESGVLNIVMDYSPSGFFRVGDSITGQQYEMVMSLSSYLDIPVEIHLETGLTESFDGLNEGKYDIVARFIPVTTELREIVAFTDNIILDRQVLIQRTAGDSSSVYVSNQLELPGKKIYVTHASPYIARLENLAYEIGDTIEVAEIDDYECEHLLILVAKGDIDYAVCDYETASRMHTDYPSLDISTQISFSQLQSWAVRKTSPQLLDSINAWINHWKQVE